MYDVNIFTAGAQEEVDAAWADVRKALEGEVRWLDREMEKNLRRTKKLLKGDEEPQGSWVVRCANFQQHAQVNSTFCVANGVGYDSVLLLSCMEHCRFAECNHFVVS